MGSILARARRTLGLALTVVLVAGTVVFAPATGVAIAPDTTVRASVATDGTQANGESGHADLSENGRYVSFWSWASNLVPGDTNGWGDIFLRDTESNETTCVSVSLDGDPAFRGATNDCDISGTGRYVAFTSDSSDLVADEDPDGYSDVFVRDMQSAETTLVSQSSLGVRGNYYSGGPSVSADGRYVAFFSQASDLVPGDTNSRQDVFVRDLQLGVTTRVSTGPAGEQGDNHSFYPKISKDGTKVAFLTYSTTFAADDTSDRADIYIKTIDGGAIERVNVKPDGGESSVEVALNDYMGLSADGRYVAFASRAGDLVSAPVQTGDCIYVRDTESDVTTAPVHATDGGLPDSSADFPSMSSDGSLVAFGSAASNLVEDDTRGYFDQFVVDVATGECVRASVASGGEDANSAASEGRIAADGTAMAFVSHATNLVADDTNGQPDIFVRSLETLPSDTTSPTVTTNAVARYTGMATISISATDEPGGSGVASVSYDLDSGGTVTTTGASATVVIGPGTHHLVYWAEDVEGNESTHANLDFVVDASTERMTGADRFSVGVNVARATFDPDGDKSWESVGNDIVIACGEDKAAADPLAAAGLCGAYDAPLFLVRSASTPSDVLTAISEIAAAHGTLKIHVVGGTTSVPDARFNEIKAAIEAKTGYAASATKDRLASGGTRYDMAGAIAKRMKSILGEPDWVLLANGADPATFFDALALSPIAAAKGYPILLVQQDWMPSATLDALDAIAPDGDVSLVVAGGPNTVDSGMVAFLGLLVHTERWAGATRYSTAVTVATKAKAKGWLDYETVGIAAKQADALTGGVLVGLAGGPMLVTKGTDLSSEPSGFLSTNRSAIEECMIFGGEKSVTPTVRTQIEMRLRR